MASAQFRLALLQMPRPVGGELHYSIEEFPLKTIRTVVATYNGEKYLEEQLDSIVNQSLKPDKIIIVDDCSKDGTTTIIGRYREKYPEMIIYEPNQRNLGHKQTFEHGISICKTDYIALSDQDDIWESDFQGGVVRAQGYCGVKHQSIS